MKTKLIASLSALPLLAFAALASAQTDLTCDDIDFTPAVTSQYPDIAKACQDVIEVDGERFAKATVRLTRTGNNRASFRFLHTDGTTGETHRIDLDPSWRANIDGREYRIRDLGPGQELNVYLPSDRWEAHVTAPTVTTFVVYRGYAMAEDTGGTMAALPSTASPLTTVGAMGGAALLTAFLLRIYRRRRDS